MQSSRPLPSAEELRDAFDEIERCLWRAQDASSPGEHLEEADSEVVSILSGLDAAQQVLVMDKLIAHLEAQDGMDAQIISEVFTHSGTTREDIDAFRLAKASPQPLQAKNTPRL